jgi:oxygen-independent coproporphyrinogen-3 oxidase
VRVPSLPHGEPVSESPAAGRERLAGVQRGTARIMLELRLAEGLAVGADGDAHTAAAAARQADAGPLDPAAFDGGRAVLTLDGRASR